MGQDVTGLLLLLLDERRAPFRLFAFEEHRVFVESEDSLVEGLVRAAGSFIFREAFNVLGP